MVFNSWVDLEEKCPIKIERIKNYASDFNTNINIRIRINKLNYAKEKLLEARSNLNSMIISLIQMFYDKDILKAPTDKVLYAWMIDNFGRYMKELDEKENFLIIIHDEPGKDSRVGVSRLSAYAKILKTSANSFIYESLLKSTEEYNHFTETDEIKREPRTFLYILFQVIQVTLSVLGGLTKQERSSMTPRKGVVYTMPSTFQSLMGKSGQELIKKGYEEDTGHKLDDFEEDLIALSETEGEQDDAFT